MGGPRFFVFVHTFVWQSILADVAWDFVSRPPTSVSSLSTSFVRQSISTVVFSPSLVFNYVFDDLAELVLADVARDVVPRRPSMMSTSTVTSFTWQSIFPTVASSIRPFSSHRERDEHQIPLSIGVAC